MAQNITLLGASYSDVPAVELPKTGGGTATFTDVTDTTAAAADVASGKFFYTASGVRTEGTASGGGGGAVVVVDTTDAAGGMIREITAIEVSGTKSITTNGTYDVTSYASASVNVQPTLQSKTATPTESSQTISPDSGYNGLSSVVVNPIPSSYIQPSGNLSITSNGNNIDVANYATVSVNVSGSTGKNVQVAHGTKRIAATAYTDVGYEITVAKTGTYNAYWAGWRSSTSGTNGAQLYVNDVASGNAVTTFDATWTNVQNGSRTSVSLTQGDKVTLRARSRGTSYYMYIFFLSIEEV